MLDRCLSCALVHFYILLVTTGGGGGVADVSSACACVRGFLPIAALTPMEMVMIMVIRSNSMPMSRSAHPLLLPPAPRSTVLVRACVALGKGSAIGGGGKGWWPRRRWKMR